MFSERRKRYKLISRTMEILQTILTILAGVFMSFVLFLGTIVPGSVSKDIASIPPFLQQGATTTAEFPTGDLKPEPKNLVSKSTGTPVAVSSSPTPTTTPLAPTKSEDHVNNETRAALVNILCTPQVGISGISGSGVVVDSRGVILTNAHVAQFFLLRDYLRPENITCVVRVGSPAQERYTATLLYLPPAWITANASQLKAAQAMGTGEDDYAFLIITGRTDPAATLPASFPRIEMDRSYVDTGQEMLLAAYPAGFLGSQTVQKSLYASSAIAYVTQLFSFNEGQNVDLFSIGGTIVSQGGSSGGAAVRLRTGTLSGIIVTETVAASTGERDLRAISLAHIDNSLAAAGKGGVISLLTGDIIAKAADFASKVAPSLTAALEAVLKGN